MIIAQSEDGPGIEPGKSGETAGPVTDLWATP